MKTKQIFTYMIITLLLGSVTFLSGCTVRLNEQKDYASQIRISPQAEPDDFLPESNDIRKYTPTLNPTPTPVVSPVVTPEDSPEVSPTDVLSTPTPIKDSDDMSDMHDFSVSKITDDIFARIYGHSFPENCPLDKEELRYLTVLHYGFDGEIHVGELIVNKRIASATLEIFEELYAIQYPIEKIRLIDEYDADDESSMEDNNSSAFNYRYIAETTVLSNHALGYAIDINTLYNPYVYTRSDGSAFLQPVNAEAYIDREADCPYYIRKGDDCYEIFTEHGFAWGGDWETKKDYQHFEYKYISE